MAFVAAFGRVDRRGWWWTSILPNIGICLCIVHTLSGVLRLAGRWLPRSLVERMADARDLRAGMLLSAPALGAIILGMTVDFGAFRMDDATRRQVRALYPKAKTIVTDSSHRTALTSPELVTAAVPEVLAAPDGQVALAGSR